MVPSDLLLTTLQRQYVPAVMNMDVPVEFIKSNGIAASMSMCFYNLRDWTLLSYVPINLKTNSHLFKDELKTNSIKTA